MRPQQPVRPGRLPLLRKVERTFENELIQTLVRFLLNRNAEFTRKFLTRHFLNFENLCLVSFGLTCI